MRILLAIEDLRTGGAQIFGMCLAQAFPSADIRYEVI